MGAMGAWTGLCLLPPPTSHLPPAPTPPHPTHPPQRPSTHPPKLPSPAHPRQEWEYLLEELALYFLVYSEGANLRHMPEGLWFLFWVLRNSREKVAQITCPPPSDPRSAVAAGALLGGGGRSSGRRGMHSGT